MRLALAAAWLLCALPPSAGAQLAWEFEGEPGHVMLLGSIHLLRAEDHPLPALIEEAWAATDTLHLELSPDELADTAGVTRLLMALALDPEGRSLPELLGTPAWTEISGELGALGLDPGLLRPWRPWYAALLVTQQLLDRLGFSAELGIEAWLVERASRESRPVRGLETIEQQLRALAELPEPVAHRFLLDTVAEARSAAEAGPALVAAWRDGDARRLEEDMLEPLRAEPALYEALVVRRNQLFADQVVALAGTEGCHLVVVGALHLVGDDGVPALLADQGLRLRQISTISKSSLPAPQSGQRQDSGTSAQRVPGASPCSGDPAASS